MLKFTVMPVSFQQHCHDNVIFLSMNLTLANSPHVCLGTGPRDEAVSGQLFNYGVSNVRGLE